MFGLSAAVRVYLAKQPADMRKSFDGLAALASGSLALDPLSGHLFVFVNKRRDRIKILGRKLGREQFSSDFGETADRRQY